MVFDIIIYLHIYIYIYIYRQSIEALSPGSSWRMAPVRGESSAPTPVTPKHPEEVQPTSQQKKNTEVATRDGTNGSSSSHQRVPSGIIPCALTAFALKSFLRACALTALALNSSRERSVLSACLRSRGNFPMTSCGCKSAS